ncbi:MAG: 30S ribosomal protein S1, partial [Calditrichaeota bacterium]
MVITEDEQVPNHATKSKQSSKLAFLDESDKVVTLDELKEESEYSPDEYENFIKLYDDSISEFKEGEVVTGKIVAIGEKEVSVDIGFKSEGIIPIDEFSDPEELKIGQDIEVFLDSVEDTDGQLVLSKKKAEFMRNWDRIVASYNNDEVIQGTCVRRIKGGIVVDLGGVDAFLPGSQIDVRPIRDFDAFIGQTLDFKIVKVNELRKNIVVSHRILVEKELQEQREKILANLQKGQILEGTVKNITDFGVFIDLGGVDGLLHINDLSWGRVNHPSEVVQLDQKIQVMVIDFNEAKDRISLGLKQLQPEPWKEVDKKYPIGTVVKGKVVSISDYGAFVELEKGVEGLIHISEMSWTQHIRHPSKILSVGETVEVKVIDLDVENKKISLSLRALQPDPWDQIEEKYPIGSTQKGIVRNLTNFGAFVELEEGIDGLVHISDLSWTKKIRHPGEVLKKGEEIEVVVLNLDKQNRRISLGYKQTVDNPWPQFSDTYAVGKRTKGKIVRMIDKGVIAELPDGVDGFVPITHLAKENL